MRFFRRQRQDPMVIQSLYALYGKRENAPARPYIHDMIMYAEIGKDRDKLDMDYVERVRQGIDQQLENERLLQSLRVPSVFSEAENAS